MASEEAHTHNTTTQHTHTHTIIQHTHTHTHMSSFPWWYGPRWPFRYFFSHEAFADRMTEPIQWEWSSKTHDTTTMREQQCEEAESHPRANELHIAFFGDLMPMGDPPAHIDRGVLRLFENADVVVGNLETPVVAKQTLLQRLLQLVFHSSWTAKSAVRTRACSVRYRGPACS